MIYLGSTHAANQLVIDGERAFKQRYSRRPLTGVSQTCRAKERKTGYTHLLYAGNQEIDRCNDVVSKVL